MGDVVMLRDGWQGLLDRYQCSLLLQASCFCIKDLKQPQGLLGRPSLLAGNVTITTCEPFPVFSSPLQWLLKLELVLPAMLMLCPAG